MAAEARTGGEHLLGWIATQALDPECDPATCNLPISVIEPDGMVVWWFTYNCLPHCQLPDDGRTMIGGREATRDESAGDCAIGAAWSERIVVSVTSQRTDVLIACSGAEAEAARTGLEALLASVGWSVP